MVSEFLRFLRSTFCFKFSAPINSQSHAAVLSFLLQRDPYEKLSFLVLIASQTPHDQGCLRNGADFVDVLELRSGWKSQPGKHGVFTAQHLKTKALRCTVRFPRLKSLPLVLSTTVPASPPRRHPAVADLHLGPFSVPSRLALHLIAFGKWLHALFLFFQTRGVEGAGMGREKGTLVFQINRGQSTSEK